MATMNVYQKLNAARLEFHSKQLKKTGYNSFAKYYYFELGDFVIPALQVLEKNGLNASISFGTDLAAMTIVDTDKPEDRIVITSPMSTCEMKGLHAVQQLGAVQTYLRRYLWVAALEIVEHDALDASEPLGRDAAPQATAPVRAVYKVPAKLADIANSIEIVSNAKDEQSLKKSFSTEASKFSSDESAYAALQRAANERRKYLREMALSVLQDQTA